MKFNPGRVKLFGLSLCAMTLLMSGHVLVDAQDVMPNTESINYDTLEQVQAEIAVDNSSESEIEIFNESSVLDVDLESELASDELNFTSEEVAESEAESSDSKVDIVSEKLWVSDDSFEYPEVAGSIEETSYDESESTWEESFGSDGSVDYPDDAAPEDYPSDFESRPDLPWYDYYDVYDYPHGESHSHYDENLREYYDTQIPIHGYYDIYIDGSYH